jgi:hypothetical protein
MSLSDVKQVTRVSSSVGEPCPFCDGGASMSDRDGTVFLVNQVNHLIEAHGFHVLHVGQETEWTEDGDIAQYTIAVLGTNDPVPEADRSEADAELRRILDGPPSRIDE